MRPKGNGLIPLHDEKQEERGFFCINLVQFLNTEAEMGTDEYKRLWDERFQPLRVVHAFIETAARYMKERSRTDLYN